MNSNLFFFSSVNVTERLHAIKEMDLKTLGKVLLCEDVQDSVRKAIKSRIRSLNRKAKR